MSIFIYIWTFITSLQELRHINVNLAQVDESTEKADVATYTGTLKTWMENRKDLRDPKAALASANELTKAFDW